MFQPPGRAAARPQGRRPLPAPPRLNTLVVALMLVAPPITSEAAPRPAVDVSARAIDVVHLDAPWCWLPGRSPDRALPELGGAWLDPTEDQGPPSRG